MAVLIWSRRAPVRQAAALGLSRAGFAVIVCESAEEVAVHADHARALLLGPEVDRAAIAALGRLPPILLIEDLLHPLPARTLDLLSPAERLLLPLRLRPLIDAVDRTAPLPP